MGYNSDELLDDASPPQDPTPLHDTFSTPAWMQISTQTRQLLTLSPSGLQPSSITPSTPPPV